MLKEDDKRLIKTGLLAGFIASLCCVGPLVLIVLGIGSAGTALIVGKQSPLFFGLGLSILIGAFWFYYLRQKKKFCGRCEGGAIRPKKIIAIIILSWIAFIVVYYILIYVLVPRLAPVIYKNFYR
jgi:mercuric ion transport protein